MKSLLQYSLRGGAYLMACSLLLTSCRNYEQGDVVKESYVHKYGVPISATDWEKQGQDGQVVQLQKDGITVMRSYAHGILHGKTTWSFPNSDLVACTEVYDQDIIVSRCQNYPSGNPMQEQYFDPDGQLIKQLHWYEEGTPAAIEYFEGGLLVSGEYRNLFNVVESRVEQGEGERVTRNNDGELLMRDKVVAGEMVERTEFYSNGDPASIASYRDGKIDGERRTFFRGGSPRTTEQWANGCQEGTTIVYQNGIKVAEVPFVHGKRHGVELRFRDGSLLVEEVTWTDDIQHGLHKIYVEGETKTQWYHQGEIVSRPTFERLNPPRIER